MNFTFLRRMKLIDSIASVSIFLFVLLYSAPVTHASAFIQNDTKLTASDISTSKIFGDSVAIDGDLAVVGARAGDGIVVGSGAAYVFERSGSGWNQIAKLEASDGAAGDNFGYSVDISNKKVVVGTPADDDQGSAYIFDLSNGVSGTIFQTAKLKANDARPSENFGLSVAISQNKVVIGAQADDDNGPGSGSAYLFDIASSSGTVTENAKLLPSDGASTDQFGSSIAIDGDTVIVGSVNDDDNGYNTGSVYVFNVLNANGVVNEKAKLLLKAEETYPYQNLGRTVAIEGNTAVVAALDEAYYTNSIYTFDITNATGIINEKAQLVPSDTSILYEYGYSLAIDSGIVVASSHRDYGNGTYDGAAYVFDVSNAVGPIHEVTKLLASDRSNNDFFGYSVAVSNGAILISAIGDDDNGQDAGSVYIFNSPNAAPILDPLGNQTISEGQTLEFTLSATDPDGDNLTYSAANLPSGSTFDAQTGLFSWTPSYDQAGNYPDIEFTVTDDGTPMQLDFEDITITVGDVNRPPVFETIGSQSTLEGESLVFNIAATDPDGDAISFSASNTPSGATFSTSTGEFSWTPNLSQAGVYIVSLTATDNGSPEDSSVLDVVITVGDNPTPTEQADVLVTEVTNLDLSQNIEKSYLANLQKVATFIEQGKVQAALNQLEAFTNKVEQDYQHGLITEQEREYMLGAANKLIADLGLN